MPDNCPYTRERIYSAIEALQSIRENQDCVIELDRIPSLERHEFYDSLASAVAHAAEAYERIKK